MTSFRDTHGFDRSDVTLATWRSRPYSPWAFGHVSELVPSARIRAAGARPAFAPLGQDLLECQVTLDRGPESVTGFLARSETDRLVVMQRGRLVADWCAAHADPAQPHIVFSVTKSITALLCGQAQAMGLLDPAREVGHYLPQTLAGAYGDCPVQHVLDMRVSLDFTEDYLNADGDYARYRRAMLWNPLETGRAGASEGLARFLHRLPKGPGPHGGPFAYQSPNSDLLGLLLEQVTGQTYADFATSQLWQPMGARSDAFITVDAQGAPRGAGGLSCDAHDLARIGQLLLEPGDIVPDQWLADTFSNGDRGAWDSGNYCDYIPGGAYRNQWYRLPPPADAVAAVGIHGQFLYVRPATGSVIVKFGSQSLPQDDSLDIPNLQFLHQLTELAG